VRLLASSMACYNIVGHMCGAQFVRATVPHWYSNFTLTNTSVTVVRTSGFTACFPYSVYLCLRHFNETLHPECNTKPVAQHVSPWPIAD
jgi:hypothetical protein